VPKLSSRSRLIVALDFSRLAPALALARRLAPLGCFFKVGSQLFTAEGPAAVRKLASLRAGIFLDLKFHDIPNTVAGAVEAAAHLPGVRLVNVHALGGPKMIAAAAKALRRLGRPPALLAVTVLTSMDRGQLRAVGVQGAPATRVLQLARMAQRAGAAGVVASPQEVASIRGACGRSLLIVTPGVRPRGSATNDQSRISTPSAALLAGADFLVVGRPITAAPDPVGAARAILAEMSGAARTHR